MLINVDASALEWNVAAFLSQDKVAHDEIWNKVDQHTENQKRFGLPSRLIAKTFVFRLIYGGSAYSYSADPDFSAVSKSEKFWQRVIDEFYSKYSGVSRWHEKLMEEAIKTSKVRIPTGRVFNYEPEAKRGDIVWPRTRILNYPVQALGADIMCIARVSLARRFKQQQIKGVLISTVHDSIVADVEESEVERTCVMMYEVFKGLPANFEKLFKIKYTLPLRCEVQYGPNLKDLTDFEYVV